MASLQPNKFFLGLNSSFNTEQSLNLNSITDFGNTLHVPLQLNDHKLAVADLHINGHMVSKGLSNREEFTMVIYEKLESFKSVTNRILGKWDQYAPISSDTVRSYHIIHDWKKGRRTGRYYTFISPNHDEIDSPVWVRTDIVLKSNFNASLIEDIRKLYNTPINIGLKDSEIRTILEAELENYRTTDTHTYFEYK